MIEDNEANTAETVAILRDRGGTGQTRWPVLGNMRDITDEERRHYHDHGVVHLPGLLDEDWVERLESAFAAGDIR